MAKNIVTMASRLNNQIMMIIVMLLGGIALLPVGCGDEGSTTTNTATSEAASVGPQDQAARLAAQSQLRNAQTAQEAYYADNERYASSTNALKSVAQGLSSKVEVTRGDTTGYEMQVTASDSARTIYIVRKSGSGIDRIDGNGDPW